MFTSYHSAYAFMHAAKSPMDGRPIRTFARMYGEPDGSYRIEAHGITLLRIHPNNTVSFPVTIDDIRPIINTVSYGLRLLVPFDILRINTNRYAIYPQMRISQKYGRDTKDGQRYPGYDYKKIRSDAPELNRELAFSLETGECISGYYKLTKLKQDADARKAWLRTLRTYRNGFKVRAKIGAFDKTIAELQNKHWPEWPSHNDCKRNLPVWLADSMKHGTYPKELVWYLMAATRSIYWARRNFDGTDLVSALDNALRNNSVPLRKAFGVFETGEPQ